MKSVNKKISGKETNKKCLECGVYLIRNSSELVCPKCGLVEELIEGT